MKIFFDFSFLLVLIFISCKPSSKILYKNQEIKKEITNIPLADGLIVYQSDNLIINKLSNHIYQHISYLQTNDFGKVACNGMLVINENKGIVFDTPTNDKSSLELITFVTKTLKSELVGLIPTHFHNDCIGGITAFENHHIQTYISKETITLLKDNGQKFSKQIKDFENNFALDIGDKKVYVEYFGEGHTKDNVVGFFPEDNAVFGGCLIKEMNANKGYLGDANIKEWSSTVKKVKQQYPNAKIVIPGHGKWGGVELFDYTIKLFE